MEVSVGKKLRVKRRLTGRPSCYTVTMKVFWPNAVSPHRRGFMSTWWTDECRRQWRQRLGIIHVCTARIGLRLVRPSSLIPHTQSMCMPPVSACHLLQRVTTPGHSGSCSKACSETLRYLAWKRDCREWLACWPIVVPYIVLLNIMLYLPRRCVDIVTCFGDMS